MDERLPPSLVVWPHVLTCNLMSSTRWKWQNNACYRRRKAAGRFPACLPAFGWPAGSALPEWMLTAKPVFLMFTHMCRQRTRGGMWRSLSASAGERGRSTH